MFNDDNNLKVSQKLNEDIYAKVINDILKYRVVQ